MYWKNEFKFAYVRRFIFILIVVCNVQHLNTILQSSSSPDRPQPSQKDIDDSIMNFSGRFVTYRLYKQNVKRSLKDVTSSEYENATKRLCPDFGKLDDISMHKNKSSYSFVKKEPCLMLENVDVTKYTENYKKVLTYTKNNLGITVINYIKENYPQCESNSDKEASSNP